MGALLRIYFYEACTNSLVVNLCLAPPVNPGGKAVNYLAKVNAEHYKKIKKNHLKCKKM